jgi:hypothetical protein
MYNSHFSPLKLQPFFQSALISLTFFKTTTPDFKTTDFPKPSQATATQPKLKKQEIQEQQNSIIVFFVFLFVILASENSDNSVVFNDEDG